MITFQIFFQHVKRWHFYKKIHLVNLYIVWNRTLLGNVSKHILKIQPKNSIGFKEHTQSMKIYHMIPAINKSFWMAY